MLVPRILSPAEAARCAAAGQAIHNELAGLVGFRAGYRWTVPFTPLPRRGHAPPAVDGRTSAAPASVGPKARGGRRTR